MSICRLAPEELDRTIFNSSLVRLILLVKLCTLFSQASRIQMEVLFIAADVFSNRVLTVGCYSNVFNFTKCSFWNNINPFLFLQISVYFFRDTPQTVVNYVTER
jgi:hypothetical protein